MQKIHDEQNIKILKRPVPCQAILEPKMKVKIVQSYKYILCGF